MLLNVQYERLQCLHFPYCLVCCSTHVYMLAAPGIHCYSTPILTYPPALLYSSYYFHSNILPIVCFTQIYFLFLCFRNVFKQQIVKATFHANCWAGSLNVMVYRHCTTFWVHSVAALGWPKVISMVEPVLRNKVFYNVIHIYFRQVS